MVTFLNDFSRQLTKHDKDDKVIFAGDWHEQFEFVDEILDEAKSKGVNLVIQVGDFTVREELLYQHFLNFVNDKCIENDIDIWIVGGNHDRWSYIQKLREESENLTEPLRLRSNIWFLPRAYSFSLNDVSFVTFGGAATPRFKEYEPLGKWFASELATERELEEAISFGEADVLLMHDSGDIKYSTPTVANIVTGNPNGITAEGVEYATLSRDKCTKVIESCKPLAVVHGHYHKFDTSVIHVDGAKYETRVISLAKAGMNGSIIELNFGEFKEDKRAMENGHE